MANTFKSETDAGVTTLATIYTVGGSTTTVILGLILGNTTTSQVTATVTLDKSSGDADIDGTLEADAITVNGTALNTVIADEATALAIALGQGELNGKYI